LGCRSSEEYGFDEEGGRARNLEGRGTGGKITNGIIVRKKEMIYLMICEIPHVRTVFRERTATHHTTLDSHPNPLMEPLVHPPNNRRLKRRWTFDEIH
jgi:hypothetical protein